MEISKFLLCPLAFLMYLLPSAVAQGERVLSTVIYTHHGDRTPLVLGGSTLTPLGAQQLWQAGTNMRNRYLMGLVDNGLYTIRDISSIFLMNSQINILSTTDQWVTGSAMAFMQGLYPPLAVGQNYTEIAGQSDLANGTNIVAPLHGYQYPDIAAASPFDLNSIFLQGSDNCAQYRAAEVGYFNSSRYESAQIQSQDFYDSLKESLLNGVFDDAAVGYFDAYYIWDYLSYGYVHNITVARELSFEDYTRVRILAEDLMFDLYANTTDDGQVGSQHIEAIAGRTLAYYVVEALASSIATNGSYNKMNLLFGDYKPIMSFAALAGLMTEQTSIFFSAPAAGSSIIFELYTNQPQTSADIYPESSDMFVRFLYRNSTDPSVDPIEYEIFNSGKANQMSWTDFVNAMSGVKVGGVEDWCLTCSSGSIFCSAFSEDAPSSTSAHHGGLKPVVAGVIGAITALAAIGFLVALVMFLGGVRFYRQRKRRSELGGFKGNEKLASDRDLTIPKGAAGVSVHEEHRGHERVGSWELKEPGRVPDHQSGIDTASFGRERNGLDHDDTTVDPWAEPVKPRDTV